MPFGAKLLQMGAAGSAAATYIEDVFSTYLYTGNGYPTSGTQNITNGIDLSTKGGLVWVKARSVANHTLTDTARGTNSQIFSSATQAAETVTDCVTAFNTNGFSLGQNSQGTLPYTNVQNENFVSWTFAKQAKFFDVVTYTGTGTSGNIVSHNLGSLPGFIIIKQSSNTSNWVTLAKDGTSGSYYTYSYFDSGLNSTAAAGISAYDPQSDINSTNINISNINTTGGVGNAKNINDSGHTYVMYLFAHDAGGFGAAGTDNVISCGSFTTNGSGNFSVNLGYEPQWLMFKKSSGVGNWEMFDCMRGWNVGYKGQRLYANLTNAEGSAAFNTQPDSTGFSGSDGGLDTNSTYIYIAIRRPHKPPTSGTQVFATDLLSSENLAVAGFPVDLSWDNTRSGSTTYVNDRLRGSGAYMDTASTSAETTGGTRLFDSNTGVKHSSFTGVNWMFKRAPGFMDVVCYRGTGSAQNISHNLGVAPEFMIVRSRGPENWFTYMSHLGATKRGPCLDLADGGNTGSSYWNNTAPTSSVFTVGTDGGTNSSSTNYVAYLFATLAGVSKVGSYSGTGTTNQINCGFSGGARFVLIKQTGNGSGWYVWDSARGIVAGNDPYLLMNSTAAEVTNTDYIDPYSAGFEISSTASSEINGSGSTYFYLAIA